MKYGTKIFLLLAMFMVLVQNGIAQPRPELGLYSNEYYLTIYPNYPPIIGQTITVRLRTFKPAEKVTIYSDREKEIPLQYSEGYWWGIFQIPDDYQSGDHFFSVWIRYPFPVAQPGSFDYFKNMAVSLRPHNKTCSTFWSKSLIWYQMKKGILKTKRPVFDLPLEISAEVEEAIPIVTEEALGIKVLSAEAYPFIIKGAKTLSFSSKSIEGSREGFVPGVTREESLRLNIAGKSDATEVAANLISTSATGTSQVSQRDDKISVMVRKGSTEAYLGDFTADFTETEFASLNKVLSGFRLKGDYGKWGFSALYSSPKGEAKFKRLYGDGTQGPFHLDNTPVVIDSERIYLDDILQKRGDDYTFDYQAGTINFTKKVIDQKSILNIYYDYRQTVYQHTTYGLRLTALPRENFKIGATYLDDSDSLAGAAQIRSSMTGEAVDPQGQYVVGIDSCLVSEQISLNSEIAYSNKKYNLLKVGTEEAGKAAKIDLATQLGPLGINLHGKRVGAGFRPLADPDPKQDITEYGGGLNFRSNSIFGAQGSYDFKRFRQGGIYYKNIGRNARATLTPDRWPSLEYLFLETEDSNDPVTGGNIQRIITRHSAETIYHWGILTSSLKGTKEKWLNRLPSEELTSIHKINFGLATMGLEKVSFASNVEIEERHEPTGLQQYRRTYNFSLSATPAKAYFISTALEFQEDSAQGNKSVADLSYRVEPNEYFRTEGKYTIAAVKEDFQTAEAVSRQTGSFSFDLKPTRYLRLKYYFKPNFTRINRTGDLSNNNEQQQEEINLVPWSELFIGLVNKQGRSFNIKRDWINYRIKQDTNDTGSTLYTLKMAPLNFLSTEFNYLEEKGQTTTLATTEPLTYSFGKNQNKQFDLALRTSLSGKFSLDSHYTYQRIYQGTGESEANLGNSISHTGSLKGIWNISEALSLSLSGAFNKTTNLLLVDPETYTLSPGVGLIYRQADKFRLDLDYTYSKSYAGLIAEKWSWSLRLKYSLSDYVNVTFRGEQERCSSPAYKTTDLAGNIEINL